MDQSAIGFPAFRIAGEMAVCALNTAIVARNGLPRAITTSCGIRPEKFHGFARIRRCGDAIPFLQARNVAQRGDHVLSRGDRGIAFGRDEQGIPYRTGGVQAEMIEATLSSCEVEGAIWLHRNRERAVRW